MKSISTLSARLSFGVALLAVLDGGGSALVERPSLASPPDEATSALTPLSPSTWIAAAFTDRKTYLVEDDRSSVTSRDDGNLSSFSPPQQTVQPGFCPAFVLRPHDECPCSEEYESHEWAEKQDNSIGGMIRAIASVCTTFFATLLMSPTSWSTTFSDLLESYQALLEDSPVITKSVTGAFVALLGDFLAQTIELTVLKRNRERLDVYRSMTLAAEGLFVSGPLLHYAYDWMDTYVTFQTDAASLLQQTLQTVLQVAIDILVMDSVFTFTLLVTSAILQGRRYDQIMEELRTDLIPAVRVSWLSSGSMAPIQLFNFGVVPVQYRVLVTNFQDVLWSASVSYMAHRSRGY